MNILSWVAVAVSTFPRDLKMTYDYMETISRVNYWRWNDYKVYQLFDEVTATNSKKVAYRLGYETWTFHMLQEYSRQVANYFHTAGLQQGDVVAQVGVEGPRGVGLWLGLSRLGVATSILPSHLPPASLVQAASSVFSKAIICHPKLVKDLKEQTLPDYTTLFSMEPSGDKSVMNLKKELAEVSSRRLKEDKKMTINEKLLYLFSPDTLTPMPVTNYRYTFIATALHKTLDLTDKDIIYSPLAEYQSEGSVVSSGQAVIFGNTVVSRGEFVANNYFPHCDHYGATVALYTEKMVKDLLALPPSAADTKHKVRLIVGKGLRNPQTWTQFKNRFKVSHIGEYFGSVDSENYNMVNSYNKAGSVGYFPWFSFLLYQIHLVAYDPNTGDVVRKTNGLCLTAENGKPGILVDELPKDYTTNQLSKDKNIIRDVFKTGDTYINTGEILMKDDQGYFYAVDTVADIKRRNGFSQHSESSSQTQESNLESQTKTISEHSKDVEGTQTLQEPAVKEHDVKQEDEEDSSPERELGYQPMDTDEEDDDESPRTQHAAHGAPEASEHSEEQHHSHTEPKVEPKSEPQPAERFQEAADAVKEKGGNLSQNDKLALYGLFKQAKIGNVNIQKPWMGIEDKLKWDAWNANKDTDQTTAMIKYREKAESLGLV